MPMVITAGISKTSCPDSPGRRDADPLGLAPTNGLKQCHNESGNVLFRNITSPKNKQAKDCQDGMKTGQWPRFAPSSGEKAE